jgi:hypothetical protein
MTFDTRTADLDKLNSATKYPQILTYHALDSKTGELIEDEPTPFTGIVIGTEKIDGTNGRIILPPDGHWIIGTREELIYAKGDLIRNPMLSIVETLVPIAETLQPTESVQTFFFEVYGGPVGAAGRQYSTQRQTSARLFDVIDMPESVYTDVLARSREHISLWRQNGGQPFLHGVDLHQVANASGLARVPLVLGIAASDIPTTIQGMRDFLAENLPKSAVCLDDEALGKAEGLILRSADRGTIAKARFQDYDRTLRKRGQVPKKS